MLAKIHWRTSAVNRKRSERQDLHTILYRARMNSIPATRGTSPISATHCFLEEPIADESPAAPMETWGNRCAWRACYGVVTAILDAVDWRAVRRHYDDRVRVSRTLVQLHNQKSVKQFANLALGISDADGNYSAAEHGLGPKIPYPDYNRNAEQRVFDLASGFISLTDARRVPELIAGGRLTYLKIGVGSEISW